jgi:two-component system response regulator
MRDKAPILLVEDNPDDVLFAVRAFKSHNFSNEIVLASDGAEALDLLFPTSTRAPLRPALVLLDLNLPKVSGIDVLRRCRAEPETRSLPVIVLTTSSEDRDMVDSYNLGANSYVNKPVDFRDFVQAAGLLGMYWLMLNQTPSDALSTIESRSGEHTG